MNKAEKNFGTSSYYLEQHFIRIIIAFFFMMIIALIDYHFWLRLSPYALVFAYVLLLFLFSGSNFVVEVNGAKRWLKLGFMQFQPSDFARVVLILALARSLHQNRENILQKILTS